MYPEQVCFCWEYPGPIVPLLFSGMYSLLPWRKVHLPTYSLGSHVPQNASICRQLFTTCSLFTRHLLERRQQHTGNNCSFRVAQTYRQKQYFFQLHLSVYISIKKKKKSPGWPCILQQLKTIPHSKFIRRLKQYKERLVLKWVGKYFLFSLWLHASCTIPISFVAISSLHQLHLH